MFTHTAAHAVALDWTAAGSSAAELSQCRPFPAVSGGNQTYRLLCRHQLTTAARTEPRGGTQLRAVSVVLLPRYYYRPPVPSQYLHAEIPQDTF